MADHQNTHGHDCWSWGPKHYECAVREIKRLRAEDEGRAITAIKVTLFGRECFLPADIAEEVKRACAAQQQQAVATVAGEFSEVRQDGEVYWLQTVLLKRPQQLPFGAPLYTAPQQPAAARSEWPERYACNGPEGTFWTDDAALANKLIAAAFDRDEWTVTDTQNPTAALAQQPAAVDEAAAIRAFEEHFEASAEDPYFEGELKLWLTAWRKALAAQ